MKLQVLSLFKSSWIIFFILFCAILYEPHYAHLKRNEKILLEKLSELNADKNAALALQRDLQYRINSQQDHEWIEMTLMRKLGLVPEGHVKVFFSEENQNGS